MSNSYNLADLFQVVSDENDNRVYLMNQTLYFDNVETMYPGYFEYYTVEGADNWSSISHKFYNTVDLWWLICRINNINNPIKEIPVVGKKIKILTSAIVQRINNQLRS